MKKLLIIIAIAIVFSFLLASCVTYERCPAYGEVHKYKVEKMK